MSFFGGDGFYDERFRRREQLKSEERLRKENKRLMFLDRVTFRKLIVLGLEKGNERGLERLLGDLYASLTDSTKIPFIKSRLKSLIKIGIVDILDAFATFQTLERFASAIFRSIDKVYPRGVPRKYRLEGTKHYQALARAISDMIRKHGKVKVADDGAFLPDKTCGSDPMEVDEENVEEDAVPKVIKKRSLGRTYSVASSEAMDKLKGYRNQLHKIATAVENIQSRLSTRGTPDKTRLGKFKSDLAQLNGKIDKLQMKGLDTVMTGPLKTGKVDVRALRKELNKKAATLSKQIKDLHPKIGTDLFYRAISSEGGRP